jgi:plastocyanin
MHTRARTATAAGLVALVSVLGACGGDDEEAATPPPASGGSQAVEVAVDLQAGEYELYCPVDDHRGQGMEGTITVSG